MYPAVEVMFAGKPLISACEGRLMETMVGGVTGLLLEPALDVEPLREGIVVHMEAIIQNS